MLCGVRGETLGDAHCLNLSQYGMPSRQTGGAVFDDPVTTMASPGSPLAPSTPLTPLLPSGFSYGLDFTRSSNRSLRSPWLPEVRVRNMMTRPAAVHRMTLRYKQWPSSV